jgi:protein-export membrane protein SecD
MDNEWKFKAAMATFFVVLAAAFLTWSVGGWDTTEELQAFDARTALLEGAVKSSVDDADRARAQRTLDDHLARGKHPAPAWASVFPARKLNLGLDLQGGIELELRVDLRKAVEASAERYTTTIVETCKEKGIDVTAQRLPGTAEIAVFAPPDKVEATRAVIAERIGIFANLGTRAVDGRDATVFRFDDDYMKRVSETALQQGVETIRNRIDKFGVTEPSILTKGQDRITVQLPGLDDPQRAIDLVGKTAQLQFRMLWKEDQWSDTRVQTLVDATVKEAGLGDYYNDAQLAAALEGKIPPEAEVLFQKEFDSVSMRQVRKQAYLVNKKVELTGEFIEYAQVARDQFDAPYVRMELNKEGGRIFGNLSGENVGKRMAIVLDDNVNSAPVFNEKIPNGVASITLGDDDSLQAMQDAQDLVVVLRAGALPAPIEIEHNRTVGKTLGDDSIEAGVSASALAAVLVLGFMVLYYRSAGFVANLAVVLNVLMLLGSLAAFGATLTLPGIGGIILTVGMAVDANVIINERIREELRAGKSVTAAIAAGYDRASSSILDANITTFLSAAVMYSYGTGPIKGFAVTLMIGLITSVYTGLFVTHIIFDWLARGRRIERLSIGIEV